MKKKMPEDFDVDKFLKNTNKYVDINLSVNNLINEMGKSI